MLLSCFHLHFLCIFQITQLHFLLLKILHFSLLVLLFFLYSLVAFFIVSANEVYESPFNIECENLIPLFSLSSGSYVKPNTPLPFLDGILPDVPNKIEPVLILEISFFLFVLVLYSFMKFTISSLARNAFTVVSASFNEKFNNCLISRFRLQISQKLAT